jgi:hypothetical protein
VVRNTNNELLAPVPAVRVSPRTIAAAAERVRGEAVELVDAARKKEEDESA